MSFMKIGLWRKRQVLSGSRCPVKEENANIKEVLTEPNSENNDVLFLQNSQNR